MCLGFGGRVGCLESSGWEQMNNLQVVVWGSVLFAWGGERVAGNYDNPNFLQDLMFWLLYF